jgi:hypothetical protein
LYQDLVSKRKKRWKLVAIELEQLKLISVSLEESTLRLHPLVLVVEVKILVQLV